ncbi:DinB family protein [Sorangium sp. So ce1389]|uniref:DinB family protein n=1 Tax=Sorangium sp. So ce1389 TaxID=3133336 RepID=UPI003F5EDB39
MTATSQDHPLKSAIDLYTFGDELIDKALDGLTREELLHRAGPHHNPAIWLAGHIALTRFRVGNILGEVEGVPHEELFGARSKIEHVLKYPEIDAVRAFHKSASERLFTRIRAVTPDQARAKAPRSDRTVGETVTLLAYHEALHVGQLLFLRKSFGRTPSDPLMD